MTIPRPKLLAALVALYAATFAVAAILAMPERLFLAAALAAPLIWLSVTDIERHEIPDAATATIALAGAVFQWHLLGPTLPLLFLFTLAATLTAAFWIAGGRYHARTGIEALGIGDAKLIGAGTLCIGAASVWAMLFVAATGGIAAALLSRRRDPATVGIAFGPFLAYAVFIFVNFPVTGAFAP
jgi:prepilin signal peptidase PulO-like enzyme (type II secretory pathway)